MDIEDDFYREYLNTATTDNNVEKLKKIIINDRQISIRGCCYYWYFNCLLSTLFLKIFCA